MDEMTKAQCNQCGISTNHRVVLSKTYWGWYEEEDPAVQQLEYYDPGPDEADWREDYELLQCCGCRTVCLRHKRESSIGRGSEELTSSVAFYPPRVFRRLPRWEIDLPAEVRSVVHEVFAALAADSRRLAMMGARTIVDMVIIDKVGDVGNFQQKLQALEERGHISRGGREHLEAALEAGNAAAHRGHSPDQEDLTNVIEIVENLLHSTYVLDRAANRLRATTPPRSPTH
jgi:hypothetical protein